MRELLLLHHSSWKEKYTAGEGDDEMHTTAVLMEYFLYVCVVIRDELMLGMLVSSLTQR